MPKHVDLDTGDPFPASWTDAIQELIGTGSYNFRLTPDSGNTNVQVVAGTNNAQVSIGIGGLWRWVTATVTGAVSGTQGARDILVVASANQIADLPDPDTDTTDYAFGLQIVASGGAATGNFNGRAITAYRKVGELDWDGGVITAIRQTVTDRSTDTIYAIAPHAAHSPAIFRGTTSQTAPLAQFLSNPGTRQLIIDPTGGLFWGSAGDVDLFRQSAGNLKTTSAFDAAGFKVAGTALASTHLSDSSHLIRDTDLATAIAGLNAVTITRSVLEPGVSSNGRAGRQLANADFTDLGLAAPSALWNLSALTDASGNGLTLTAKGSAAAGAAVGVDGAAGGAAIIPASSGFYRLDGGTSDPTRLMNGGTVGFWFRTSARGADAELVAKSTIAAGTIYQIILAQGTSSAGGGVLRVLLNNSGNSSRTFTGQRRLWDDKWHHVVISVDPSTGTPMVFIDGTPEPMGISFGQNFWAGQTYNVGPALNIGSVFADASNNAASSINGYMDEVFFHPEVLTVDHARALYAAKVPHSLSRVPSRVNMNVTRKRRGGNYATGDFPATPLRMYQFPNGALTDGGSQNVALTVNGSAFAAPGPAGNKSYAFQHATSDYLYASDTGLPTGGGCTMGAWVRADMNVMTFVATNLNGYGPVITYGSTYGTERGLYLMHPAGPTFRTGGVSAIGSEVLNPWWLDDQWHFIVGVDNTTDAFGYRLKLYVDGKLAGIGSGSPAAVALGGASGLRIGGMPGGADTFQGSIANAFILNSALTPEQVWGLYNKGFQSMGPSPKDAGAHVERMDASNLYVVGDTLEPQHSYDLVVS